MLMTCGFNAKNMKENKYYTPEIEFWKDVVDYEDEYEVSNLGNVRRKSKNLSASVGHYGYNTVSLSKNGKCITKLVHRIVAEAFIDNPELKEQVNHKDCVKTNNKLSNLEWVTPIENILHAVENHRQRNQNGENNNMSKLTEVDVLFIRQLIDEGMTTYKIHKNYYPYLHQQTIYAIKQRRLWKQI